jgi:hypothetical protein
MQEYIQSIQYLKDGRDETANIFHVKEMVEPKEQEEMENNKSNARDER